MDSKLIGELRNSSQLISEASRELKNMSEENKNLRVMLWRMVEKHGTDIWTGVIDNETYDNILSANIYLDNDLNICFRNTSNN